MTYSLIIPAYNESARISATLEKVLDYVRQQAWSAEVLVVNDGSTDNTAELVRHFAAAHPAVRLIENPENRGKGYSVRHGVLHATGDIVLFSDADLSSPIEEAPKLLRAIAAGADVAIGSRWLETKLQTERQPILRQIAGRMYNLLLRVILRLKYEDTQCGFKAFTREAAQAVFPLQRIERWGFDPEILFLARKKGLKTAEVPVAWAHDDRSKINPVVDGIRMFGEMLKVRWLSLTGAYRHPAPAVIELEASAPPVPAALSRTARGGR
ncbi:MAG TPA: dolichyl-phosphate beta-glucosyltransferase [Terriglobales bacterium]|nr:dolichyl-phosphate beta-glucosyltransferase [Terriglobales bacterium]